MTKPNLLGSGARAASVAQEDLADTVKTGKGSGLAQASPEAGGGRRNEVYWAEERNLRVRRTVPIIRASCPRLVSDWVGDETGRVPILGL